jgi:sec-independent protein translocase protein TatB
MFGMSGTELIIILILALLLLGPDKLPEMAKLVGKTMREFQKTTDDVRSTVQRELYKLEQQGDSPEPPAPAPAPVVELKPAPGAVTFSPSASAPAEPRILPMPTASAAPAEGEGTAKVLSLEGRTPKNEGQS